METLFLQAFFDCPRCDLRPRVQAELGQDIGHVRLDGALPYDQFLGNLAIRFASGNERGDLALARRQPAELAFGSAHRRGWG